jgi:hydroxymethylbilane synthase
VLKSFGGGCHLPLGCYCRKQDGEYQIFTSKADEGDEFPDRLFIQTKDIQGIEERILKYYAKDRQFPKKVFISRDVSEQSYFRRALEKHKIEVEGRSLIRTVPVITKFDSYILKNVDWVFFTSKNAVEYFFNLQPLFPKKVKFGVMGTGSEDMLRRNGHFADYVGDSGDTAQVGRDFAKLANGQTVLFPGSESAMRSVQKEMSGDTKIIDLPVYETVLIDEVQASGADVLVFTSPSNVEAYFTDNLVDGNQKLVAIGKSTGNKLAELGLNYTLPFLPDEVGLAEAVFGL